MGEADDHQHYDLHRLVVLSDAVFAIAMTLLALELRPPGVWDGSIPSLLTAMRTPLLAYGMSFIIIFGYWRIHCRSFRHFAGADRFVIVFTILSLGLVTLLPIATRLFIEHRQASGAMVVYSSLVAAIGVVNALTWGYAALNPSLMHPHVTKARKITRLFGLLLAPIVAFGGSLLAFSGRAPWALALLVVSHARTEGPEGALG